MTNADLELKFKFLAAAGSILIAIYFGVVTPDLALNLIL